MKKTDTTFTCDFCGKKSEPTQGGLPYHKGWMYIYQINGKIDKQNIRKGEDMHLCSKDCLVNLVDTLFSKSKKVKKILGEKSLQQKEARDERS